MNNVRTSFLSLLDGAYSAVEAARYSMGMTTAHKRDFQAPFLELKAVADAQAKQITALEQRLEWYQTRLSRLENIRVTVSY